MKNTLVFSTVSYDYLAAEICKSKKLPCGKLVRKTFPDNEVYLQVESDVSGRNILLIGGTCSDTDTLELIELGFQFVSLGCDQLVIFIPYFGYGTMERSTVDGEVVRAKTRARILSTIPQAPKGTKFLLFEPHTEGLPYYFENFHLAQAVSAEPLLTDIIKSQLKKASDVVLGSVDFGKAKLVHKIAQTLNLPAIYCGKVRKANAEVETFTESFNVKNKKVVLLDDIVRTGNSLHAAAKLLLDSGASEVSALVVHAPVKPKTRALKKLKRITYSNSHPNGAEAKSFSIVETIYTHVERVMLRP